MNLKQKALLNIEIQQIKKEIDVLTMEEEILRSKKEKLAVEIRSLQIKLKGGIDGKSTKSKRKA